MPAYNADLITSSRIMSKPVLIVDDDVDQRMLMQEILELFGHRVLAAEHGGEALQWLSGSERPGVIFLDITMPVMSGREFLTEVHSGRHPALEAIPVVVVSAVTDFVELQQRYASVIAVLRKPLQIDSLQSIAAQYAG